MILPGAELVLDYCRRQGVTPHALALRCGIDPAEFRKLLRGERSRVTVATAAKIEDCTGVKMRAWILPDPPSEPQS